MLLTSRSGQISSTAQGCERELWLSIEAMAVVAACDSSDARHVAILFGLVLPTGILHAAGVATS